VLGRKSAVVLYRIAPEIVVESIIRKRTGDRREHHALKRLSTDGGLREIRADRGGANLRILSTVTQSLLQKNRDLYYILLPELGLIGVQGIIDFSSLSSLHSTIYV
jgi:hypothetical protein